MGRQPIRRMASASPGCCPLRDSVELDNPATSTAFGVLGDLARADNVTVRLLANPLLAELDRRAELPWHSYSSAGSNNPRR